MVKLMLEMSLHFRIAIVSENKLQNSKNNNKTYKTFATYGLSYLLLGEL